VVTALVDTSVWIDYLRAADSVARVNLRIRLASEMPAVVMTEPIAMELLAGPTSERGAAAIGRLVDGLPSISVEPALDYRAAAAIYRATRRIGRAVRNLSDCLIAAIAVRAEVTLIHKDADFEAIANVSPLRHESWR
jgi:predicted nucleic acid-binding protein